MTSLVFWVVATALYGGSLLLFLTSGEGAAAPTDYRAWLLFALATLAAAVGNASRTRADDPE